MWPIILSNRLPIVALVGRYPANKLMGRGLIPARKLASRGLLSPHCKTRAYPVLSTVSSRYSSCRGRLSTRYSPVRHSTRGRSPFRVRLACVKHAASVQSEPESNSPVQICSRSLLGRNQNLKVVLFFFVVCKISFASRQRIKRRSPFYASAGRASTSFLPIRARCPAETACPSAPPVLCLPRPLPAAGVECGRPPPPTSPRPKEQANFRSAIDPAGADI